MFQPNDNWGDHIKSWHNEGGLCNNRAAIMEFSYRVCVVCVCVCVCVYIYSRLQHSTLPASYGKLGFRVSQARARTRDWARAGTLLKIQKSTLSAYAGDPDCAWMGSPITTTFGFALRCSIITRLFFILAGTSIVISLWAVPPFMPVRLPHKLASLGRVHVCKCWIQRFIIGPSVFFFCISRSSILWWVGSQWVQIRWWGRTRMDRGVIYFLFVDACCVFHQVPIYLIAVRLNTHERHPAPTFGEGFGFVESESSQTARWSCTLR
jgi:hypothetical protein